MVLMRSICLVAGRNVRNGFLFLKDLALQLYKSCAERNGPVGKDVFQDVSESVPMDFWL